MVSRETVFWSAAFGVLAILIHIPFVFRYDFYGGSGNLQTYLMLKRILRGEFYIYQWAGDYTGMGPVDFITALLFKIFGPSIPLAAFVSLLFYGIGVSLLVGYVALCFGKRAALFTGCALAIGMPQFLHHSITVYGTLYNTTPLYLGGFLLLMALALRRGPRSWVCVFTALVMGWHWYAHKHVVIIWLAIAVGLITMPEGREFVQKFLRSKMALFSLVAFLIGYSPELIYKLGFIASRAERTTDTASFLQLASPDLMARNWYMLLRCTLMYFDADPWARAPTDIHYLNHMEYWESYPLNPVDTVGVIAAFLVITFILQEAVRSYRQRDLKVFVLSIAPLVNAAIIVLAARSNAAYYRIQQYLFPAGVLCVVWLGVRLSRDWEARRWASGTVLALLLFVSLFHQLHMLQLPDALVDYRKTAADIEAHGYRYGLSWYPFSHTLTALSDEKVMFGIVDRTFQSPYQKPATEAETVAVVWPAKSAPPFEFAQKLFFGGVRIRDDSVRMLPDQVTFLGRHYQRIGEPRIIGELGWAPYRKVS